MTMVCILMVAEASSVVSFRHRLVVAVPRADGGFEAELGDDDHEDDVGRKANLR